MNYYTPELSEFHLGFEYEYLHDDSGWIPVEVSSDSRLRFFEDMIRDGKIRVKGLDREDTLSLGWVDHVYEFVDLFTWPAMVDFEVRRLWLSEGIVEINDGMREDRDKFFYGTLRNKSELKMIMKMLGIKL